MNYGGKGNLVDLPKFNQQGCFELKGYDGKTYYLTQKVWETKTKYPERQFLKLNFDKIELTITYPNEVRRSTKKRDSKILYRLFDRITIREGITVPWPDGNPGYIAVVINETNCIVQTIYPTPKIKKGEKLWPK